MTSAIDDTKPVSGNPTTASVRSNFSVAKDEISALQQIAGFADYQDTATTGTPIAITSSTWTKLTNNGLGSNSQSKLPSDIIRLWNTATNQLDFTTTPLYAMLILRADIKITTTSANQVVRGRLRMAIGDPVEFSLERTQNQFKTAGTYQFIPEVGFYIGSAAIKNNPAEIQIWTDASATVVVNGWYIRVNKYLGG